MAVAKSGRRPLAVAVATTTEETHDLRDASCSAVATRGDRHKAEAQPTAAVRAQSSQMLGAQA